MSQADPTPREVSCLRPRSACLQPSRRCPPVQRASTACLEQLPPVSRDDRGSSIHGKARRTGHSTVAAAAPPRRPRKPRAAAVRWRSSRSVPFGQVPPRGARMSRVLWNFGASLVAHKRRKLELRADALGPRTEGQSGRLLPPGGARRRARPRRQGREGLPGHPPDPHHTPPLRSRRAGDRGWTWPPPTGRDCPGATRRGRADSPKPCTSRRGRTTSTAAEPTPVLTGVKAVLAALRASRLDPGSGPAISR